MKFIYAMLLATLMAGSFTVARAVENPSAYPLLSAARFHAAVRTEYAWWNGKDETQLPSAATKEWGVGLAGSYSMVPRLSSTARIVYFVDSRITQFALGLNLEIYSGGH